MADDDQRPFVVIKFIKTIEEESDDIDVDYEVGLAKWITDLNEDMVGTTKWPPSSVDAGKLIRKEALPDSNWPVSSIEVIRYFDTVKKARDALKRLVDEGLTSYETEKELGRGKRKKRPRITYTDKEDSDIAKHGKNKTQSLSDDSDSDYPQQKKIRKYSKSKKISNIPEPPPLSFQNKTDNMRLDQNDRNKEIIVTIDQNNTKTVVPLMKKSTQQTEQQELTQKILKKECLKNVFKQKNALTVSQLDKYDEYSLQRQNVTLYHDHTINMQNKENLDDSESKIVGFDPENFSERVSSSKSPRSKNTEILYRSPTSPKSCVEFDPENFSERASSSKSPRSKNTEMLYYRSPTSQKSCSSLQNSPINPNLLNRRRLFSDEKVSRIANDDINKSIKEIKSLCKTALVRLEELSSKVDVTIMNQARLNRSLIPAEKRIVRPSDLPALPIYTESDLKAMERFLEDSSNLSATVHYLASFPLNKNEGKATAQVMTKLMSNALTCSYNFKGTEGSGKKSFQNLHLWEVVQGVIQTRFPESDLSQAKDSVMSWLRNAPWRKQEEGFNSGKRKIKSPQRKAAVNKKDKKLA